MAIVKGVTVGRVAELLGHDPAGREVEFVSISFYENDVATVSVRHKDDSERTFPIDRVNLAALASTSLIA